MRGEINKYFLFLLVHLVEVSTGNDNYSECIKFFQKEIRSYRVTQRADSEACEYLPQVSGI